MKDKKVSLQQYFEDKFTAADKALVLALQSLTVRLEATDKAQEVYRSALDKRLETMNEFREALKDQNKTSIARPEHELVVADIRSLRESRATLEGKASMMSVIISYGISIISLFVAILALFLHGGVK
jgi:ethanolamine ammonia-lyase small subunit